MSEATNLSPSNTNKIDMTGILKQGDVPAAPHSLQIHDTPEIKFTNAKGTILKPYKRIRRKDCYKDGKFNWKSILDGWRLGQPDMIISVIGDIRHSLKSRDFLKSCVIDLFRMTKNTWIFTTGYDTELTAIIAEAVSEITEKYNKVENEEVNVKTTLIGFATWNKILGNEDIQTGSEYNVHILKEKHRQQIMANQGFILNESCTHFLLVDDWNEDPQIKSGNLLIHEVIC